jgi:5-hydroxyisourate hydrolase
MGGELQSRGELSTALQALDTRHNTASPHLTSPHLPSPRTCTRRYLHNCTRMPPSTPSTRAHALSQHLHDSPNPTQTAAMASPTPKPPITCHVLDTSIGKPASSIPVRLTLLSSSPSTTTSQPSFTASTNSDGRVTTWTSSSSSPFTAAQSLEDVFSGPGEQKWELRFDTAEYFEKRGMKTFFPECVVVFVVGEGQRGIGGEKEHFHVPVLVGGFGWSTYRGS